LAVDFENGAQWWLTSDEERELEMHNKAHQVISPIRERLLNAIDTDATTGITLPAMTAIDLLQAIGLSFPTMPQCKECAGVLRELFGEPKRIKGRMVWRVPMKHQHTDTTPEVDDDHLY
jgi:putative DNA primase/helicase